MYIILRRSLKIYVYIKLSWMYIEFVLHQEVSWHVWCTMKKNHYYLLQKFVDKYNVGNCYLWIVKIHKYIHTLLSTNLESK